MTKAIDFTFPYPPSVNTYWRHPTSGKLAGRHLISEKGREYREAINNLVAAARGMDAVGLFLAGARGEKINTPMISGPLAVDIEVFFPDRRRRDLDNILKSLLDSMTHAGVWEDDSQIEDLRIRKGPNIAGMVKVSVSPAGRPAKKED